MPSMLFELRNKMHKWKVITLVSKMGEKRHIDVK